MVRTLGASLLLLALGTGAALVLSQAQLWYTDWYAGDGQLLQFLIPGTVITRSQLLGAGSGPPG